MYGWNGQQVAYVQNSAIGSNAAIDILKGDGTWEEVPSLVPVNVWTQLTLALDLQSATDRCRVRAGSGPWSGWQSLGSQENYLRHVKFYTYGTGSDSHDYYIDDMMLVPEPASMGVLAFGGLALLRRRRTA